VTFPDMLIPLNVGQERSIELINDVLRGDRSIAMVANAKPEAESPGPEDLYSVGVSLYELVTGKKPFDGDSQFAIMAAHLEKLPVPPITLDTRLPQMLNDVILMSIAKDPAQRFQTAQAFAAALGSVRQSLGIPEAVAAAARTVTLPPTPPARPARLLVQRFLEINQL